MRGAGGERVYVKLKNLVAVEFKLPVSLMVLSFRRKILSQDISTMVENLYFIDGTLTETITFELTLKPTLLPKAIKFCEQNNISLLTRLEIKFLTSQFYIDVFGEKIELVKDVKMCIEKVKNIPIVSQDLMINGRLLNDGESIVNIYIEHGT